MQNQFNKTIQEKLKDFQVLFYKFKDVQRLQFLFQIQGHSRTFKFCTNPERLINMIVVIEVFPGYITVIERLGRLGHTCTVGSCDLEQGCRLDSEQGL